MQRAKRIVALSALVHVHWIRHVCWCAAVLRVVEISLPDVVDLLLRNLTDVSDREVEMLSHLLIRIQRTSGIVAAIVPDGSC